MCNICIKKKKKIKQRSRISSHMREKEALPGTTSLEKICNTWQ